MSKIDIAKGTVKTLFWLVGEEWNNMDHKLLRIAAGAIGFTVMGLLWFFVIRNILPF